MAKSSPKKGKKEEAAETKSGEGILRPLFRTLLTTALVIMILLVTILLFTRTDGFRSYLEGWVEREFGLSLNIGTSSMDWTGNLMLGDISPATTNELGRGKLHADRLVVHTDLLTFWRDQPTFSDVELTLDKWSLTFAQTADGAWEPSALNGMNKWLSRWCKIDVAELDPPYLGEAEASAPRDKRQANLISVNRLKLVLTNGILVWEDAKGGVWRSAHDVEAYLTPLDLPTRKATHIHVMASEVDISPWAKIRDLDVELLRTGDSYRVLRLNAERQSVSSLAGEADVPRKRAPTQNAMDRVIAAPSELVVHDVPLPAPESADEFEDADLKSIIREELSDALGR